MCTNNRGEYTSKGVLPCWCVVIDYLGRVFAGYNHLIQVNSPLVAEALSLRDVVLLASNLNLLDVIFEVD